MVKAVAKTTFVFLFMAFLAAQASTGFMRELFAGGVYPRALRAFDWILESFFTGPFGRTGGTVALLVFGGIFAGFILWRGLKDTRPEEPSPSSQRFTRVLPKVTTPISRDVPIPAPQPLSAKVWISGICHADGMSYKRGTRTKFYNHDWEPATYEIPVEPDEVCAAYRRHWEGYALQRSDFPEALAVFDPKRFAKEKDFFMAGPFAAVKGKLVDVFSRCDLGEGGLIPFTIYEADLVTPHPGAFYFLNFGARKNSLLPEQCGDAHVMFVHKATGKPFWKLNSFNPDADVVLTSAALEGPDIWFEDGVYNEVFMSDALAQALIAVGMKDLFKLKQCRVVEVG